MAAHRIGIIGFGKIAQDQHLPSIRANPDFELLAVARHEVQAAADVLEHVGVRRRRRGEARDRADVHVRGLALLVQEGSVHGAEPVEVVLRHPAASILVPS